MTPGFRERQRRKQKKSLTTPSALLVALAQHALDERGQRLARVGVVGVERAAQAREAFAEALPRGDAELARPARHCTEVEVGGRVQGMGAIADRLVMQQRSVQQHEEIVQALEHGDSERAAQLVENNFRAALPDMLEQL